MPRVVILCPRRAGIPERDAIWKRLQDRWAKLHPELRVYEGHHTDGPFNRSAAINQAARLADQDGRWDFALIIDSDVFLAPQLVKAALKSAAKSGKVTWAFRRWRSVEQQATKRMLADEREDSILSSDLAGHDMDLVVDKTNPISWSCCFVVPRSVFDDLGGFDERFRGWGWEDGAWASAVMALHGVDRIEGDLFHLWHPPSTERRGKGSVDYVKNAMLGRRYMVARLVETGQNDRGAPVDLDLAKQEVLNLKHDDAQVRAGVRGIPDWANWWPSTRELVDGWKNAGRTVTVIVHAGPPGDRMQRREWLRETVASLEANLRGSIVKRVIYDDSGDPAYRAWMSGEFGQHGYYVVGPHENLGYTQSMRAMWSYLRRRCDSEWVWLAEDDFTLDHPVELDPMIDVLRANPHLKQMALLRHAYYEDEKKAGSIIAQAPAAYTPATDGVNRWLEHRKHFTSNPGLFARSLCDIEWPDAKNSERVYTDVLCKDPRARLAYWGHGEEQCTHIGHERTGSGY